MNNTTGQVAMFTAAYSVINNAAILPLIVIPHISPHLLSLLALFYRTVVDCSREVKLIRFCTLDTKNCYTMVPAQMTNLLLGLTNTLLEKE